MSEPETAAQSSIAAAVQRRTVSMAEQTLLQRIIRHRRDLEFLAGHPIQARFARSVHERVRAFGAAMRSTGLDCEWGSIASLGVVCRLETETAERAVRLRSLLMDAEARWEALHDRLVETRALADL
jgi:hypothetical protein